MIDAIKKGDLVFLRDWPLEDSSGWTLDDQPPLLVIDLVESKQMTMFNSPPRIEKLIVLDSTGKVRTMPAGYFVSADTRDLMIKEIHRARGR